MTKKFLVSVRTDAVGSDCYTTVELDAELTESEIFAELQEIAFNYVSWGYTEIDD